MNQQGDAALRRALEHLAEGVDDNPERYHQVAARVRVRRQQAFGGVAAAVLLVTGSAAVVANWLPTAEVSEPSADPPVIECPPPVATFPDPPPAPATPRPTAAEQDGPLVPDGPAAVQVCGLRAFRSLSIILDQNLERLVAALNALPTTMQAGPPASPGAWVCTQEMPLPLYHLVFAYPDGSEVTALLEPTNCRRVGVDGQVRVQSHGQMIHDLVYEMAERQRLAEVPSDPPDPTCPDPTTLTRPVDDPTPPRYDAYIVNAANASVPYPAVEVAVCRYSSTDPQAARLVADTLVIDAGEAERARELVNGQEPETPYWSCEPPAGWFDVLVFTDTGGGLYEVRVGRGDCKLFYSGVRLSDAPEPALRAWLDNTLSDLVDPQTSPR